MWYTIPTFLPHRVICFWCWFGVEILRIAPKPCRAFLSRSPGGRVWSALFIIQHRSSGHTCSVQRERQQRRQQPSRFQHGGGWPWSGGSLWKCTADVKHDEQRFLTRKPQELRKLFNGRGDEVMPVLATRWANMRFLSKPWAWNRKFERLFWSSYLISCEQQFFIPLGTPPHFREQGQTAPALCDIWRTAFVSRGVRCAIDALNWFNLRHSAASTSLSFYRFHTPSGCAWTDGFQREISCHGGIDRYDRHDMNMMSLYEFDIPDPLVACPSFLQDQTPFLLALERWFFETTPRRCPCWTESAFELYQHKTEPERWRRDATRIGIIWIYMVLYT